MKKLFTTLAASAVLATRLCAQILTVNSGFSATPLFSESAGTDISAIGSDLAGNLYYLNSASSGAATQLIKRTAATSYSDPTALYTYSGFVYGDFVKVNGSTVYFGESSTNTIRSVSVTGNAPALIATIPRNYDFAVNGNGAFVDAADSNFANNVVSKVDLLTGQLTTVLKTDGASGALALAPDGTLLYGASTYIDNGGIYSFTPKQVSDASNGAPLILSQQAPIIKDGANQFLSWRDPHALFQADSSGYPTNYLNLFDPTNRTSTQIGQIDTGNDGDLFGGLALVGNGVAVEVSSQFGAVNQTNSTVFLVTPEPGSDTLLIMGASSMLGGCRVRKRRVLSAGALGSLAPG